MANDLLKKLEDKINEAIETIELSRMEVSDLKEQNEELENRYADWETKLSTLIEKFEQLEDSEDAEFEEEVNADSQDIEDETEDEFRDADKLNSEDVEEFEVSDADSFHAEDEDSDEGELDPNFSTSAESLTEASESVQHSA